MTRFVVVRLDGSALLWLSGAVGAALAPTLDETLRDLADQLSAPPVVDLTGVTAIDENAVSVLAAAAAGGLELRLPGGQWRLVRSGVELRSMLLA
jgi:anti-anti-sigma regulatory factor